MVTKKTRLLSAIMAVMMLVSMLISVVLPVSAENTVPQGTLPSITALINDGTKSDVGYTVSNAAEWKLLENNATNANITAKHTIYITGDIDLTGYTGKPLSGLLAAVDGDMNNTGDRSEIIGLTFENGLFGIKIPAIRDLIFKNCTATAVGGNQTFLLGGGSSASICLTSEYTNLAFYDCSATKSGTGNTFAFLAREGSAAKTVFHNIFMKGCTMTSTSTNASGDVNHALILSAADSTIEMKDIVLIDNEMNFYHWDSSYGIVAGEMKGASTFENILVVGNEINISNNSSTSDGLRTGLLLGNLASGVTSSLKNAIVMGNTLNNDSGEEMMTALVGGYGSGNVLTATNVYAQRQVAVTDNVTLKSGSTYTYGNDPVEAALALNAAGVEKKWGITADGQITLVKDGEKEVKKVTIEIRDPKNGSVLETYSDFVGLDGKLLDTADYADKAVVWTEDLAGAIAGTVVIGYVIPAHTCEWEYTDNGDGTHAYTCGSSWTVDNAGTELTVKCDKAGEASCNKNGFKNVTDTATEEPAEKHNVYVTCSLCGHVFAEDGEFECRGELKETSRVPATSCKPEDAGSVVISCTLCDYTHTGALLGDDLHKLDAYVELPNFPQYHEIRCSVCGKETGELEKHAFGAWQQTAAPSVDVEGEETRSCLCGKAETRPVAKLAGLKLEADKAKVGESFQVKIDLKNNPGVGGFNFKLTYDADALTLKGSEKGDWDIVFDAAGIPGATGVVEKNIHVISGTDMNGDGTVLILNFEVKDEEALLANTETVVAVEVVNAYSHDDYKTKIAFEPFSKELLIYSGLLKGDMTDDKLVNLQDAIYLLRYLNRPAGSTSFEVEGFTITDKMANLTTENDNVELEDGTNSGTVNIYDVIYLLKYLNFQISDAEFFGE